MPSHEITIQSIWGGVSGSQYFYNEGEYLAGIAIDPDYPISSSNIRTSGLLCPTIYEKFSGGNVTGYPNWFTTDIKDTLVYAYMSDGKFVSYSSTLGSETLVGTPTSGAGNGMAYYNNYIYLATPTDISRYGPLDGVPALTNTVWTGGLFGQTALTNTVYPSLKGNPLPNHPILYNPGDTRCYVGDVNSQGQGVIHRISTVLGAAQGSNNDGVLPSTYGVCTLPFSFYPTAMESFGTDVVIAAIQTTNTTLNQGRSALFFWNPTATSTATVPYKVVYLPDPLVTALKNVNGNLVIWTGNAQNGVRISSYTGGENVQTIAYQEEGTPPQAGAVDAIGDKFIWGANTTYPVTTGSVFSYGSKNSKLPSGVHNIARSTSAGANPTVTAVKFVQQASNVTPRFIMGWGDGSAKGIDKLSTTATYNSVWRSQLIPVGKKFAISRMRIPFAGSVTTNVTIIPTIYIDDASSSTVLETISFANDGGARKKEYKEFEIGTVGLNNFFLEITWTGSDNLPVALPIIIEIDEYDDEPRNT